MLHDWFVHVQTGVSPKHRQDPQGGRFHGGDLRADGKGVRPRVGETRSYCRLYRLPRTAQVLLSIPRRHDVHPSTNMVKNGDHGCPALRCRIRNESRSQVDICSLQV